MTITVSEVGGAGLPLVKVGDYLLMDITSSGDFDVNVLMEAIAPVNAMYFPPGAPPGSFTAFNYLFNLLHTNPSDPVYGLTFSSYEHTYYTDEDIWIGNDSVWNNPSNWSYANHPPMLPYDIRIPDSPAGGNQPVIDTDTIIFINSIEVDSNSTLNVDSLVTLYCGLPATSNQGIPPYAWDTINNPATGETWMQYNLGAYRQATASDDYMAYGHLFQWGRNLLAASGEKDNHEFINWTASNAGTPAYVTTFELADSDYPGHSFFITVAASPFDWRSPPNNILWQGLSGTNNPCPDGSRIPTSQESG